MRQEPTWRRYMRLWGSNAAADVDDEVSFHIEMRVRELMSRGASEVEARVEAERAFGDVGAIRNELVQLDEQHMRRARRSGVLADLWSDVRIAHRMLLRRKLFAFAVTATLALGIAASATIFALVDGVLLRPLPYPSGDRLVVLWDRNIPRARAENVVSVPEFEAWQAGLTSVTSLAALVPSRFTVLGDEPERLYGAEVSPAWFDVVGVAPALGRGFAEADIATSGRRLIVLSHELWVRRHSADRDVIGSTIELEGAAYAVLGVMPEGFDAPRFGWLERQEFWVPFVPDADNRTWGRALLVLGRLREDATLASAQAELSTLVRDRVRSGEGDAEWTADVVTLFDQLTKTLRTPLLVLLAAVALLQLIAVVNAASLLLARAQERDLEFGVRTALGAGRGRLVRQLLAEGLALVSIGAPAGLLLTAWLVRGLVPFLPVGVPRLEAIRFSSDVVLFAIALAIVTFIALGLVPLVRMGRRSLDDALRDGGRRVTRARSGSAVIVAEIALALTLTVAAGLALRSFLLLTSVDLGFASENHITMRLSLPSGVYDAPESREAFFAEVLDRIEAVPSVDAAGAISAGVLNGAALATTVQLAGTDLEVAPVATIRVVTPQYFDAAGVVVREGRSHAAVDDAAAPLSFVVGESLARALSPDQSIIGRRIVVALNNGMTGEVVGVVGDVRYEGPDVDPRPAVYIAHAQWPHQAMDVVVRSSTPLPTLAPVLRAAVWSVDRTIPVQRMQRVDHMIAEATSQNRINMIILVLFSFVAVVLAGAGVYCVLALEVGRRRHELGIRMSLGARPAQVRSMVLSRALGLALVGIGIGIVGAYAGTRAMQSMLYGISASDPRTYGAVALLMLLIALLAAYMPARRATRIDPITALRSD